MAELCMRCLEEGEDRRTLYMACFYQMSELPIHFVETVVGTQVFYTLRVCKGCRAEWLRAIRQWFTSAPNRESCGSGIFVREYGTNIEVTKEEFAQRQRMKEDKQ